MFGCIEYRRVVWKVYVFVDCDFKVIKVIIVSIDS